MDFLFVVLLTSLCSVSLRLILCVPYFAKEFSVRAVWILSLTSIFSSVFGLRAQDKPSFEKNILPILRARCAECHDERKQKSGYRIDLRSTAVRGGDSGKPAIVPGKSGESDLLRRVQSSNETERMPPEGKRLSADEIKLLTSWIDSGANWPDALAGKEDARLKHWAFQAPVRPALAKTQNEKWVRNPIDRFILAKLEKEGLKPSAEADRVTLIRRLSLDLIGLPPKPEEVDAFLKEVQADPEQAYEKLVDRLLASPHYGERWARTWLDAARYADSDGFEKDKTREVYFYRDWVINAFNRDLPYDKFIIEQIAGDLLPKPTQDQIVATGFLRNSMLNEEGGIDPEQFRMEAMFDRMDAIGKGMLGLTIQCTQCHNHKYDPLTQAEYYRMFAFLNSCYEANVAVYTPPEQKKRAEIFQKIKSIEDDLRHKNPDWQKKMATWEKTMREKTVKWTVVRPALDASGGQKHYLLEDGSILAQGYAPTKHTTDFTVKVDGKVAAVQLELLNDPNLPVSGPGRSIKGLFGLTEFKVDAKPADNSGPSKSIKIIRATADVNPPQKPLEAAFDDKSKKARITGPIAYAIDGNNETAWTIDIGPGRSNVPRKAVFVFEKPVEFPKGTLLTFKLVQNHGGWNSDDNQNNNLGRFRFSVTDNENAEADPLPVRIRQLIQVPAERRTKADEEAIFSTYRTMVADWKAANDEIEKLWQEHPAGATQLVLNQMDKGRETHILKRGDFLKPGDAVGAGVPAMLHPLPANSSRDRLAFARWLVDRKSPTTARALVNRLWQAYFGTGIVSTSEDFGMQSDTPSHPELLDWLAVEFMEPSSGKDPAWSLKHIHRLIALSATYRQSAKVTPELLARDPDNRLLARGARFRVDAEVVRDIALTASGLLNEKIGGRSVFPPLPVFMLQPPVSYGPKIWPEDTGPERYRRALYTFRYRSIPYPVLQTFDAPNGDFACVRRARSNTPLQALMTLNEPVFVESARALALKILREGGATDAERLNYAFKRCVSRMPTDSEKQALLALLTRQQKHLSEPGAKPMEVIADDPKNPPKLPEKISPAEAAAWTILARVLLNLDETICKE
jgi:hypothetical protein